MYAPVRVHAPVRVRGCQGCGACLITCPSSALRPVPGGIHSGGIDVVHSRCTGCGECIEVCPVDAIEFADALPSADAVPLGGAR